MFDEVLTINEAAALLEFAERSVYAAAKAGETPAVEIRGLWSNKRAEFDQQIDAQPRREESSGAENDGR